MNDELIRIAQKAERLSQMQWTDLDYLEGGHSIFAVWLWADEDTDGLMFTGTYTPRELLDKYPKLDRANGGHLTDVVKVLHEYGLMSDAELEFIRREFYLTAIEKE